MKSMANKKKRNINVRQNGLSLLKKEFPAVFKESDPVPLKKEIHKDILEQLDIGKHKLARALRYYTNWPQYLKSIKEGSPRYDLHGKPTSDIVSKEEQLHAKEKLKMGRKKLRKKRPTKHAKKSFGRSSNRPSFSKRSSV